MFFFNNIVIDCTFDFILNYWFKNDRFETQQEMNRQLERQLEILKDKIQQHNGPNKKGVVLRNFEDMTDVMFDFYLQI